ncbi:hypothetical protein CRG98_012356 [Punica granatum]|uniref:Retrotransposon gag domain-containing protein n=1 Tax=Punica granatum TaxID=22663 RepID=A0A2I0KG01_PUNGR|nr:hypothetical protein CRG98_012356 [Punica granatum]
MAEGDQVDISEEVNPPVPVHSQPPLMHALPPPTPAGVLPGYSGAPSIRLPPPTSSGAPLPQAPLSSSTSDDQARITALEGTVNQMAANMAELLALLKGLNRASSSSTPPPGQGPTVDPAPRIPPTQAPENMDAPAPPTLHASMAQPFTSPYPPPPAPTAVPLPPAAFLTSDQVLSAPPPVPMPAPAAAYTVPPPTVFPTSGNPTHAAQFASPTQFFPKADAEQERRMKRMEETIRALQANDAQPDTRYGDCNLFPGMRLPLKFKIPELRAYGGTTDPRHHLCHYRGKMLQYWEYEEFVIHSFQDSLSGSALDWFMSLKVEDIPTWEDLSRKFIDQYRYCAEAPPTLLELSTKEMARGQRFEEYAAKWRAQAAKHIPPISEAQQVQLFHSTLRAIYYSHQLAHTSSFSDLIEAGKKLDLGIKLGRMEGPADKRKETSKKAPAMSSSSGGRRGKEVSIQPISPGSNFDPFVQDQSKRCEYHQGAPGHTLDNCWRLRDEIQRRIDSNRLTFNAARPPNVQANLLPDHRPSSGPSINMISIYVSERDEEAQENPLPFPYTNSKVPWTYEGTVGSVEQHISVMGVTRSGRVYESLATKDKGKALAVEVGAAPGSSPFPSKKSLAHISLLALLLGSQPHREALLWVLTAAQVPKETLPDKIEETVGSIFSNTISFSDDELPSEVRPSKTAVRAFDGSRREVNGEIDLLIDVGPCSFNITFQVLDIPNAFSLLLGRPWIHSAGAVPSSLHQRLKFIVEEKLITVKGDEDYAIYKETAVPYISVGDDENLPFHSFETISVIRDYGESGSSRADRMIRKVLLCSNYIPSTGLGARGQGINCPIEVEGDTSVPPLSHFFPGPSHTKGGTLDGPSSDSDDTPATPSAVCAVTEEIPSGVHNCLAQENEELDNWTSVSRYSAVITDV